MAQLVTGVVGMERLRRHNPSLGWGRGAGGAGVVGAAGRSGRCDGGGDRRMAWAERKDGLGEWGRRRKTCGAFSELRLAENPCLDTDRIPIMAPLRHERAPSSSSSSVVVGVGSRSSALAAVILIGPSYAVLADDGGGGGEGRADKAGGREGWDKRAKLQLLVQ